MKYLGLIACAFAAVLQSCDNSPSIASVDRPLASSIDADNTTTTFLELLDPAATGVGFKNGIVETEYKNHRSYTQIYNGGGVAVGDLNGDDLPDIYFAGNSVDDKLYFNQGNFKFKEVTVEAGLGKYVNGWSYGVNMVDINSDGHLDIYVCKAGPYANKQYIANRLFINQGDGTFTEEASDYGLDIKTYSVQAAFLDYDLDGDLDMYLANHPVPGSDKKNPKSFGSYVKAINDGVLRTDNFYENDNGKFVEKTDAAGLVNYGYKNAIGVGDLNKDGYPDLYVSTDFGEPDLYYVNNGDKTFNNKVRESMKHITYYSMGSDVVDVNNDGQLDIYITDMTPDDHIRSKTFMPSMDTDKFNAFVHFGFHHQYMLNSLQINNGDNSFSELGQFAGIAKTDWSWAPLFFDIDLDGKRDLFVTNGIKENLNDNDIKEKVFSQQDALQRPLSLEEYLEIVPSDVTPNQVFKNNGDLKFSDVSTQWVDNANFNSNGAAYADLDRDGDLDMILNNMDAEAAIYRNNSPSGQSGNALMLDLEGPKGNSFGLGAKVTLTLDDQIVYYEHYPSRGYLSSVDYTAVLGIGTAAQVSSIEVIWPDGKTQSLSAVPANSRVKLSYGGASSVKQQDESQKPLMAKLDPKETGLLYFHKEDRFDDFRAQVLLPYSQSQNGPFSAQADVNADGLVDIFVGGAAGSPAALYMQKADGSFSVDQTSGWLQDAAYEDTGAAFLDFDGDGDMDLYVASGGAAAPAGDALYQDRLYENNGAGVFKRTLGILPAETVSNQVVLAEDVDGDGDTDLFIGGRVIPDKYPFSPESRLLINQNGRFQNITQPDLKNVGLVTGAVFSDYDGDGDKDLVIVGEWSPIQFFANNNGTFRKQNFKGFDTSNGLWFAIQEADLDSDGDMDYLLGNLGTNSKMTAKEGKPFHVFCDDFDNNGTYDIVFSKDYKGKLVPMRGRECSSEQMPFILDKFTNFQSFANASLEEIIGDDKLAGALHYSVEDFHHMALINEGGGDFTRVELPRMAQVAPIMDFELTDLNGDGQMEIIAVGNLYPTEVETTRYDASRGIVMNFKDGSFEVLPSSLTGLAGRGDAKDVDVLSLSNGEQRLLVTNNNGPLEVYRINKP
ncbi:FG-GAP-like repeat-containing protein [Gilvibacter sediminis]|uniref:FG-GAP-like repeat-containing protein n=1 Tax=Gilvibacter sediminis TaxID=379071 RepID=UPI0023502EFC|nr:FG-GAP-like repeat-containing protein [Gilvibacter sediminis]MDC7997884.1 FG-GAP-like repeat-containing protein [Gilvibacter sediminis]